MHEPTEHIYHHAVIKHQGAGPKQLQHCSQLTTIHKAMGDEGLWTGSVARVAESLQYRVGPKFEHGICFLSWYHFLSSCKS